MIQRIIEIYVDELDHEHRFMLSLICALLIVLGAFNFWPVSEPQEQVYQDIYQEEEILIDQAIVTRQQSIPPPPPRPQVPVPVPNDEVIEEEIEFPDLDDLFEESNLPIDDGKGELNSEARLVGNPKVAPRLVKIVEPTVSEEAKRRDIKVQIMVNFLVSEEGRVEEVYISEIRLYNGDEYEVVNQIGYGLMEAVLEAALKWKFRPAKDDGENVKTYVENSFKIGF